MADIVTPTLSIDISEYSPYEGGFSRHRLRKWSLLVRGRDGGICQLCRNPYGVWALHAHHVRPKGYAAFAPLAYELDNGISLCPHCHLAVVHSTDANWRQFYQMFRNLLRRRERRDFNKKNQHRV